MIYAADRYPRRKNGNPSRPSRVLITNIRRLRGSGHSALDGLQLSEAYRELLRSYRKGIATGAVPTKSWHRHVQEALAFLGGQADRHMASLADYDHRRNGP